MQETLQEAREARAGASFPQILADEIDYLIVKARIHGVKKYRSRNDFVEIACIKLLEQEEQESKTKEKSCYKEMTLQRLNAAQDDNMLLHETQRVLKAIRKHSSHKNCCVDKILHELDLQDDDVGLNPNQEPRANKLNPPGPTPPLKTVGL